MKRIDSCREFPKAEDTLAILISKNIAKVTFKKRGGDHHSHKSNGGFEWEIKKDQEENFTAKDIGVFVENFPEISRENLVVRHIRDESFRVVEISK